MLCQPKAHYHGQLKDFMSVRVCLFLSERVITSICRGIRQNRKGYHSLPEESRSHKYINIPRLISLIPISVFAISHILMPSISHLA